MKKKTPIRVLAGCLARQMAACSKAELAQIARVILNALKHDELRAETLLAMDDAGIASPDGEYGTLQAELVAARDERRAKVRQGLAARKAAGKEVASLPQTSPPAKDDDLVRSPAHHLVHARKSEGPSTLKGSWNVNE